MLGSRERQRGGPERTDPPQALHLACVEQSPHDRLDGAIEGDQTMHGIAKEHRGMTTAPREAGQSTTIVRAQRGAKHRPDQHEPCCEPTQVGEHGHLRFDTHTGKLR